MSKNTSIALLLIVLLGAFYYFSQQQTHTVSAKSVIQTARPGQAVSETGKRPGPYSVLGQPSISAQFINGVLCKAHSPACGTGQALYELGKQYGIDPAYALAFFKHESSYGLYGVAATNLGIGNIRCTPGYSCLYGFRAYSTWQQGYADWYQLISYYVNTLHKSTVSQIVPTYAPSTENDVDAYISSVEQSVSTWQQGNAL